MLAIPLLSQGTPFGVLSMSSRTPRPAHEWNQRLAEGLTHEAALAISNARLYEAAQQKQRRLLARLRQLEHLAETLAHDLKGPGARMEELAKLLAQKFAGQVDDRTAKWLRLLQENGKDIVERVEGIEIADEERVAAERSRVVDQLRRLPPHRADGKVVQPESMAPRLRLRQRRRRHRSQRRAGRSREELASSHVATKIAHRRSLPLRVTEEIDRRLH